MLYPDTVLMAFNNHNPPDHGVFCTFRHNTRLYCNAPFPAKQQFYYSATYIIQWKKGKYLLRMRTGSRPHYKQNKYIIKQFRDRISFSKMIVGSVGFMSKPGGKPGRYNVGVFISIAVPFMGRADGKKHFGFSQIDSKFG